MALNLTNMVRAPLYNFEVFMVRSRSLNARRERARLRARFNALLPIGQRRMWRMA